MKNFGAGVLVGMFLSFLIEVAVEAHKQDEVRQCAITFKDFNGNKHQHVGEGVRF